jgi:hypothetical protein
MSTKSGQHSRVPLLPHFDKPAFSRIPKNCEPQIVVEMFEEFVKRRVKMGEEWHTAGATCNYEITKYVR